MEQQKTETPQATCSSDNSQVLDLRAPSGTEWRAIRRGNRELVTDVDGVEWEVTESRRTRHGFKLLLGLPTLRRNVETGGRNVIGRQNSFNTATSTGPCGAHNMISPSAFPPFISFAGVWGLTTLVISVHCARLTRKISSFFRFGNSPNVTTSPGAQLTAGVEKYTAAAAGVRETGGTRPPCSKFCFLASHALKKPSSSAYPHRTFSASVCGRVTS